MAQPQITVKKQQELQQQYTNYKNNLQQLAQKIGDIEQDTEEHKLVLETLTPLPPDRKCFRMVNGVLVEKTVKDVTPALQINSEGLKKVLEELVKQYKRQQDDMEKWKVGFLSLSIATLPMSIPYSYSSRTSYDAATLGPIIWTC
ncbi:MAG: hypothetical protein ALECFALPRED_007159 [Alectoria fallacina]|uniref:Prefoldin subunit 2 n=1 Tax=Alectoria fallacina TaxID=1903189 RepID=A0A8H3IXR6_9LECA|nr:MAG: hypothetical protein ALECFALPRED_007159 [Alectoria fallacina]